MGIKNLNKFLRDKCPDVFVMTHLSVYAYKKIAIDISLYMHKFKAVCGDNWLSAFLNLVGSLRNNEIHCVFIFDGKAPQEKDAEKAKRKEQKEKLEQNVMELEEALHIYHTTGVVEPILVRLYATKKEDNTPKRLLGKSNAFDINWVEDKIDQKRKQIITISHIDFEYAKELFDILQVPYYTAIGEAEKMCAKLCIDGYVEAVLSEDTDVIAYKAPLFLTKIDTREETCMSIEYNSILTQLGLTSPQMLDLCIMCGTDYNTNIPKIGVHNAYKNLLQHTSIDNIGLNTNLDISILSHVRSRELFTIFSDYNIDKIPYCGQPDFDRLEKFATTHKLSLNVDKFKSNFTRQIVILDDE